MEAKLVSLNLSTHFKQLIHFGAGVRAKARGFWPAHSRQARQFMVTEFSVPAVCAEADAAYKAKSAKTAFAMIVEEVVLCLYQLSLPRCDRLIDISTGRLNAQLGFIPIQTEAALE